MGRFSTAVRAFFGSLMDAATAERVATALSGAALPAPSPPPVAKPEPRVAPAPPPPPAQNAAVTLLATLQREARLVDFLQEDLSAYADEQIGAAVREVHRDAAKTLDRLFGLRPVVTAEEGSRVDVPAGFDAARYRLTGRISGTGPYHGALRHRGWEATHCQLPTYTGSTAAALTIAPAEVELT